MVNAEKLITDHLPLWSSTVKAKKSVGRGSRKKRELYGVKKLRELILELAFRGLLVPQDPSDEPAKVLLDRISKEREKLIESGQIKRAKVRLVSSSVTEHDLPPPWKLTTLGMTGDWGAGSTPKRDNPSYYGGNITWLKSGELNDCETVKDSSETITDTALTSGSFRKNKIGDILIAMYGATIGKVAILAAPAVTNQAVCGCTPFKGIANRFLYFYLLSQRANFHAASEGGAQPNISKVKLLAYQFPLPPLAEQHRIVAKVDELMALCDQLEQQQEDSIDTHETLVKTLLDALTTTSDPAQFQQAWQRIEANFHLLFTTESSINLLQQTILQLAVMGKLVPQDPTDEPASKLLKKIATEKELLIKDKKIKRQKKLPAPEAKALNASIPDHWKFCTLNDLILFMDAGWSPACPPTPSPSDEVWGVLKTTAVQQMKYLEVENKVLAQGKEPRPQFEVNRGDILITRAGPKNRVGVSCLVKDTRPRLMLSDKIIRFHLLNDKLDQEYITLCLNSGVTATYLEASKSGMAASQMNISQGKLQAAPIPLPPSAEQRSIVAKVDELMTLCDTLKAKLQTAQTTQQTLTDTIVQSSVN